MNLTLHTGSMLCCVEQKTVFILPSKKCHSASQEMLVYIKIWSQSTNKLECFKVNERKQRKPHRNLNKCIRFKASILGNYLKIHRRNPVWATYGQWRCIKLEVENKSVFRFKVNIDLSIKTNCKLVKWWQCQFKT